MRGVKRPDLLAFNPGWPPARISWRNNRRLSLKLSADGIPQVSAPFLAGPNDIKFFLGERLSWLNKQRAQLSKAYEVLSGDWLGRDIGIIHSTGQLSASIDSNSLDLKHPVDFKDWHLLYPLARPHARHLLNKQAEVTLPPLVAGLEQVTGNRSSRLQIRFMRSRWGSCNHLGKITLNSQLTRLPLGLIKYVIIHELAHVHNHNHGPTFWQEVEKDCQNYLQLRRQLKQVRLFD